MTNVVSCSMVAAFAFTALIAFSVPARAQTPAPEREPASEPTPATTDANGEATVPPEESPSPSASPVRYPIAMAERPLTLPQAVLTITPSLELYSRGTQEGGGASAAIGVIDDVSVYVAPLHIIAGPLDQIDSTLGGIARFIHVPVLEAGLGAYAQLTWGKGTTGRTIGAGIPVRLHAGRSLRLDLAPGLTFDHVNLGDATLDQVVFSAPLAATISVTDQVYGTLTSGFGFIDNTLHTKFVPAGALFGYTLARRDSPGPAIDAEVYVTFPSLFVFSQLGSAARTDSWILGLTMRAHFYL